MHALYELWSSLNLLVCRYTGCNKAELVGALQVLARDGKKHLQQVQVHQEPDSSVPTYGEEPVKVLLSFEPVVINNANMTFFSEKYLACVHSRY